MKKITLTIAIIILTGCSAITPKSEIELEKSIKISETKSKDENNYNIVEYSSVNKRMMMNQNEICQFKNKNLPKDFDVLFLSQMFESDGSLKIAGSHIDASEVEVVVNNPNRKSALILSNQTGPTLFNISWTKNSEIIAVFLVSDLTQKVIGIPKSVPVLSQFNKESYIEDDSVNCDITTFINDKIEATRVSKKIFNREPKEIKTGYEVNYDKFVLFGEELKEKDVLLKSNDIKLDEVVTRIYK